MEDLNDYRYFTEVVRHGGFSAAGRALQLPKSKLSRRVAGLEKRLGVHLIERSPHRFRVTDLGQTFYDHCRSMLIEADRARSAVCGADLEPHGSVRVSSPTGIVDTVLASLLPAFLLRHPRVHLQVLATDRRTDLVDERIHVALRSRPGPRIDASPGIEVRPLGSVRRMLVASPELASAIRPGEGVESLQALPTVSLIDPVSDWLETDRWELDRSDGERLVVHHEPRLATLSVDAVLEAARAGVGVGLLPDLVCEADLRSGALARLWPDWCSAEAALSLESTSTRGQLAAVRSLIEYLEECFAGRIATEAVPGGRHATIR